MGGQKPARTLRIRLHHLLGRLADPRIHHTFIFDQEPHFVELASIGMKFPSALGRFTGISRSLLQTDDRHCAVEENGIVAEHGERGPGHALYHAEKGSVFAAIRHHWREYPKGLAVADDGIDVRIWPEDCRETLKFSTPFRERAIYFNGTRDEREVERLLAERPDAPLNLKSFDVQTTEDMLWVERILENYAPGRVASHNDTGTDDGFGAAKTTELFLRLSSGPIDEGEAEALAAAAQEPLIAPADPAHTCATKALGHFYHAGDPRFEKIDQGSTCSSMTLPSSRSKGAASTL